MKRVLYWCAVIRTICFAGGFMFHGKTFVYGLMALFLFALMASSHLPGAVPVRGGGGPFVNSGQSLGGETGNDVALGDLDGDGDLDAFVANDYAAISSEANQVWFNDGNGFFTVGPTLGTADGEAVALGDLDGDGDLDAVVATFGGGEFISAIVWLNQGGAQGGNQGDFAVGVSLGSAAGYGVALGDVDNDGDLDALVVGNSNQVWLNNGNATFTAGPALPFLFSHSAVLADLDGDGWLDAVIADSGNGSSNRVYWNDANWNPGPGSFTAGDLLPTTGLVNGAAIANLDSDNQPDIFLAAIGPDQIYWNEGGRTFSTAGPLPVSDNSWDVVLADVDGDTLLDAVVANITAEPNRLWRNEGSRVFTVAQEFGDEIGFYWSRGLGLADLNGDGSADLFEVTTAEDRVWFNQTLPPVIPNETRWQIQLLDARGDAGYSPALALDGNGYPHISYGRLYQGTSNEIISYLMYARWDGVRWHNQVISNSASETSIALDSNGNPHIVYTSGSGNTLQYAVWDGAAWQVQDVDQLPFPQTMGLGEVVLDVNNHAHISYNTFSNTSSEPEHLKYAHWNGVAWQFQTVETGLVYDSNLALDATGRPHLAYAFREAFDTYVLKYAFWDGAAWQIEILDGEVEDGGVFVSSFVLDAGGSPHIGYTLDNFDNSDLLKYAYWDGATWQTQTITTIDPGYRIEDISLDVDSADNPHLVYYLSDPSDDGHWIQYTYWDGVAWQMESLDGGDATNLFREQLVAVALDAADNLHAAYYTPGYEDLRYITRAPNWQIRTVPETGTVEIPSIAVANTGGGGAPPSIGYYKPDSGQVKLTTWDEPWTLNPLDFVSQPVTDLSVAAGPQFEHISYYDADQQRLLYSYWNGATWTTEVVDEAGNVGRYNDLLLAGNSDGGAQIAYWDDTTLRIKLARPVLNSVLWDIFPNNAGPALNSNSGPLSAAVLPGGIGVSYYDGVSGDLRLARWTGSNAAWTDERVDGLSADVGRLNALQTDWTEGIPVVAYYDETNDAIRFAYKTTAGWQIQTAVGSPTGGVTSLALELGLNSRHRAYIAYTTNGALNVAVLRDGRWQIEVIESGPVALRDVSLARDTRLHLAYVHPTAGLQYAFRTATLEVNSINPAAPPGPLTGGYNPLDPCPEDPWPGQLFRPAPLPAAPPAQHDSLNDLDIFGGMMHLFSATEGGQHYIDLYTQHGSEMGRLGLEDPSLLWDSFGTLQNFLPGLEALVTGRGDEVIVTQEMVDDALAIWQRLASAGSPALANTINTELARTNNLQDFVGLSFNQWAEAIGVEPPSKPTLLPLVIKQ